MGSWKLIFITTQTAANEFVNGYAKLKLLLNFEKSKAIPFEKLYIRPLYLFINNICLEHVRSIKFLGMVISSSPALKAHTDEVPFKMSIGYLNSPRVMQEIIIDYSTTSSLIAPKYIESKLKYLSATQLKTDGLSKTYSNFQSSFNMLRANKPLIT